MYVSLFLLVQGCLLHLLHSLYILPILKILSFFFLLSITKPQTAPSQFICPFSHHSLKVRVISDPPCVHNEPSHELEAYEG